MSNQPSVIRWTIFLPLKDGVLMALTLVLKWIIIGFRPPPLNLNTHLPNATFHDATGLVNWQRAVKSEAELGYMRQAGKIVSKMHERIREKTEVGMRKSDLVAEIYDASLRYDLKLGRWGLSCACALAPLWRTAPHLTWNDTPLKSGEGTFFEIAGVVHRYRNVAHPLSRQTN